MKIVKRRIALLLSLCLVFSNVMPALAAETASPAAQVQAPVETGEQTEAQTPAAEETTGQTGDETKKQEAEKPCSTKEQFSVFTVPQLLLQEAICRSLAGLPSPSSTWA